MEKVIFGIVGQMASGKDTCAEILKDKYGASVHSFSTMLGDVVRRFNLEYSRDNLIKISEFLRSTFGENILAKTMAEDVKNEKNNIIIIPNIRRMADIEFLSKNPNFVLVHIFADPKVRYQRMLGRNEKTDDQTKTFEEFLQDHKRETELTIENVAKEAKEQVNNNGNLKNLENQLEGVVKKYL